MNKIVNAKSKLRKFSWISSVDGNSHQLSELNKKMSLYYSTLQNRKKYQEMIDVREEKETVEEGSIEDFLLNYIRGLNYSNLLEVGCSNGRTYRRLIEKGYAGLYSGIEVADYLIQQNIKKYPKANWHCADAYSIPFPDRSFDVCFSLFVLEHLVYPKLGLNEMFRVLKPGGKLVLVFPDFVESRRLASQQRGFSCTSVSEKLRNLKLLDAVVGLYDSKIRLPKALSRVVDDYGFFPVNTQPICLSSELSTITPDVDAIYIASKKEIHEWAVTHGCKVEYPYGIKDTFAENALMSITKQFKK